jgi:cytochrome c peroxidase
LLRLTVPAGLDLLVPVPDDNLLTVPKVELGRRLFFDPIMSRDRQTACASCHRAASAFADTVATSRGAAGRSPTRNTPTLLNRAFARHLFWDGRAATLEDAVLQPVENPRELDLRVTEALTRLSADSGYRESFQAAFSDGVTRPNLARVLASFIRTLLTGDAPLDRFMAGDSAALSIEARLGRRLFLGKANCAACHSGPNLTDDRFHNTGVSWGRDPGRVAVSSIEYDRGKFRTPTLRNVASTAPYMHDGSVRTLRDVVMFYSRGGNPNPNLDHRIGRLNLREDEVNALVAFLKALSSGEEGVVFSK